MMILRSGDVFAGCRIISLCGSGGTGVVYFARDALDRQVALKIVAMCDSRRELEGIRRYSRIAEGNPHLIRIYHAGIENDFLYYIMEAADNAGIGSGPYIPKTLAAVLSDQGRLPAGEALELIRRISTGLSVLHEAGLVHRDIKPENIIFVNGFPKLCDPGLVASTDVTASLVGTLGYLPHECFDGQNLNTPGRDVYALGKVFYVAVTGETAASYPRIPQDLSLGVKRKLWPLLVRACNSNPKHRFQTIREFCQYLPDELPRPGRWERSREAFRQWRLAHYWFMPLALSVLGLLFLGTVCGTGYYLLQQKKRAEYILQCRMLGDAAEKRLRAKQSMLVDQLASAAGEKTAADFSAEMKNPPENPAERLRRFEALESRLKAIAERQLIPIPKKASPAEIRRISDHTRGLFASPLGGWIKPKTKREILAKLESLERRFFSSSLRPGKDCYLDSGYRRTLVYVPAGVFRNREGKLIRIRQAFWCSDGELRCDDFTATLGINVQSVQPDMPMVKLAWNDLLEYCYLLTREYKEQGLLPDGYIVRPLTSCEWQWACRGAWSGMGRATAFLRQNSLGKAHPIRSGEPNLLGIYDMLGNVSELTAPESSSSPPEMVEICGANYAHRAANPEHCTSYLKYQFLLPHVGSRIAFAPGNMEFFEKYLWITARRHTVLDGVHYELLVSNQALTELPQARSLCHLLGGHLLVPESSAQLQALNRAFWENNSFPVAVDISVKNGVWTRPDGSPCTGLSMPKIPKHSRWILTCHNGGIKIINGLRAPGLICQWTEAEYRKRTDPDRIRKCPGILHSFQIGNSLYLLFPYKAHNHTARQIAQLLGGRLAEPRNEQLRKRFQRELAPWKDLMIMMGGVWKYGKWVFQDGSALDLKLTLTGGYFHESRNLAAPGLLNGQFGTLQQSHALLLEIPLKAGSPVSRD